MEKRNRPWGGLAVAAVAALAVGAAVYAYSGRQPSGTGASGEAPVTNLSTSNAGTPKSISHPLVGKPMPNVTLPDLNGKPQPLSAFQGKQIVLSYWTTW